MIAGGDDVEHHERRIEHSGEARSASLRVAEETASDDDRVADVHARDRSERVVERADQTAVEVDMRTRDRVGDADACESRRRCRIQDEPGERERAGDEQRRTDERIRSWATPVDPEQEDGCRRQVKRQVRDSECADESGHAVRVSLQPALDEDVQRLLERRDAMRICRTAESLSPTTRPRVASYPA
jgi:hypothetical protein